MSNINKMIRSIDPSEYAKFATEQFIVLPNLLSSFDKAQAEIDSLVKHASPLKSNPHSAYDQVLPNKLTDHNIGKHLLQIYNSDELKILIQSITKWNNVFTLPLRLDGKFEINCKTNIYYSSRSSYLGWHYDQTYNYKGDQVVVVLTLENNSHGPNLEYLPVNSSKTRSIHLAQNSISVHNPDVIFHRVLPIKHKTEGYYARRIVFVMRYTNNPEPVPYSIINHAAFLLKHPIKFIIVRDYQWISLCIFAILMLIYICTELKDLYKYYATAIGSSNMDARGIALPENKS
jgi:hypothetical protein